MRERLDAMAAESDADEMMLTTIMPDSAERVRSYERVACEVWPAVQ